MKAICYKQVQRIKQKCYALSKVNSIWYLSYWAPLGLPTNIDVINSIAKSTIALVQNKKRCSFCVTACVEDFEDDGLIRVESKAKILKRKNNYKRIDCLRIAIFWHFFAW